MSRGPLRVLLVDDNVDSALSLAFLLQIWGYETQVAHDGPAGVETAKNFCPHVAILDIGLPGLDGFEVARQLRTTLPSPPLMLIALTGYHQAQFRKQSQEAGFHFHIVKPIDMDSLQLLLQAANSLRQSEADPEASRSIRGALEIKLESQLPIPSDECKPPALSAE